MSSNPRDESSFLICHTAILKLLYFLVPLYLLMPSCDKRLEPMNVEDGHTQPGIGNLFTSSVIRTVGTGTKDRNQCNLKYLAGTMQYMASLGTDWSGDKNVENNQFGDLFETIYSVHLKEIVQAIASTEGKPELANQHAIASIWRVFILHRATDIYGDVPYTEAGLRFLKGSHKAKYDKQSEIYPKMLSELESAIKELDPRKVSYGPADVIYQGNLNKWRLFGYSLMLRLGMRLTNVDVEQSRHWVQKAMAGGVFKSNDEMAMLKHTAGNSYTHNWDAFELKRESFPESIKGRGPVKLAKTLIDLLQTYNDPRLPFYATLWEGNIRSMQDVKLLTTTNPVLQKGLPNGYDATSIKQVIPDWNSNMLAEFSEPNTGTIASLSAPSVLLSYAEVEFLLAEAALRGWAPGTPEEHYKSAISASMKSTVFYPRNFLISQTAITEYLEAHPLDGAGFDEKMEQIHTQFYLAHFMWYDNFEAFSNYRRTGYPKLLPPNYPGNFTGGKALMRLRYPVSEASSNKENYEAAIASQGPDLYTTAVWWDK